jgi:predicted RNase H-like HicB family nuclease
VKQMKVKMFSLAHYVEQAVQRAKYIRDEDGVVVAKVPGAAGYFSQGATTEEARENLRDAIEGNVLVALQLGLPIPRIPGVTIREVPWRRKKHGKTYSAQSKRRGA